MALIDEVRMDRTVMSIVTLDEQADDWEYWQTRPVEERSATLELTWQVFNGYAPDTTRFHRVIEVVRNP